MAMNAPAISSVDSDPSFALRRRTCSSEPPSDAAAHVKVIVTKAPHKLILDDDKGSITITDPNGVVTALTYDTRQRVTSRATAGETTVFDYWPTGLLKKVTLPDGSYLAYTYDGAAANFYVDGHLQYSKALSGLQTETLHSVDRRPLSDGRAAQQAQVFAARVALAEANIERMHGRWRMKQIHDQLKWLSKGALR